MPRRALHICCWMVVGLLAACNSQDDESGDPAPPGLYPATTRQGGAAADNDWPEISDENLQKELAEALDRARNNGTLVLLEFMAPWCPDCREVVRISEQEPAASLLASRYERVLVNVGAFDRHQDLRDRYNVDRIATFVVLNADGTRRAQTTLEPITKGQPFDAEAFAEWLRAPEPRPDTSDAPE